MGNKILGYLAIPTRAEQLYKPGNALQSKVYISGLKVSFELH